MLYFKQTWDKTIKNQISNKHLSITYLCVKVNSPVTVRGTLYLK